MFGASIQLKTEASKAELTEFGFKIVDHEQGVILWHHALDGETCTIVWDTE